MKTVKDFTILVPYLNKQEIVELRQLLGWKFNVLYEEDKARVGSDLMYQRMWNSCDTDIFIMHADMLPDYQGWEDNLLHYVNTHPEAGLFGCKLLYPVEDEHNNNFIQSAGGWFNEENIPQHYGSGLEVSTQEVFKDLEVDTGQYDKLREVAWSTFGGIYIRREVLNDVGDFDPSFEWSYNRDVDYCLSAREKGWKIYQVPVIFKHYESRDNKRLRNTNPELNEKESRNLTRLQNKWQDNPLFKTVDEEV
tara:strand:+ start:13192 stop:13941 length:750 start_codon:yes stop_codon:yes gene_type:complete